MGANSSSIRSSRAPSPKSHSSTRDRTPQRQSRRVQQVVIHQPDGNYMDPTRRHRDHDRQRRQVSGKKNRQRGPEIVEDPVEEHHRYKVRQTRYKSSDATYMENYERYRAVEDAKRRSGNYERKMYIPGQQERYRGTAIIRDEKPYTYVHVQC